MGETYKDKRVAIGLVISSFATFYANFSASTWITFIRTSSPWKSQLKQVIDQPFKNRLRTLLEDMKQADTMKFRF